MQLKTEIGLQSTPTVGKVSGLKKTMRQFPPLAAFLIWLAGSISLPAQTPAPSPAAKPLLRNGGFEMGRTREDLWDGVDNNGFLAGERELVPILTTSGSISESSMPVSVAVGDMNGDKLPDIVTMDPLGFLRIYFNSGTPTEPKFSNAELAGIFLTRSWLPGQNSPIYLRYAPRIALYDTTRSGKLDLYVGNYWGEVFYVKNDGSAMKPEFRQPTDITRLLIPTAKDANTRWGNVFAPAVWDWTKDGKEDLLLGEGSYSANNIHLLINSGSGTKPVFEESNRSVLAFGDGREQLTPTIVDYNGDGNMDLLVSERTGKVALHLNKGNWKAGDELPFASFVNAGASPLSFGGICTISTGDLNGDGLFDIIAGKTNGRIAVSYNTGTKTEPKFSPPVELKGENVTKALKLPSGWDVSYGLPRGNYYGYASVVTEVEDPQAAPPEGKACLKFGYQASLNKIMGPIPPASYTGALVPSFQRLKPDTSAQPDASETIMRTGPANYFLLRMPGIALKADQSYSITFKVKGAKVSAAQVLLGWAATLKLSDSKTEQTGDRGAVKIVKNQLEEAGDVTATFSPSGSWSEVKKDFSVSVKERRLKDPATVVVANLEISFMLAPGAGELYIDDVKLTAK